MRLSKYKDMDSNNAGSQSGLMPIMIADPTRTNGGSLCYNNMLTRQDGSVMTKDHIKKLRERQGFCLYCQGEPVQLFEIKKSQINPLFRGKEALDTLHQSHNGICLKCNPSMDPHKMTRRESLRRLTCNSSVQSNLSTGSRSQSSSPSPPATLNSEKHKRSSLSLDGNTTKVLAKKRNDTARGRRRRSKVMAEMETLDLFAQNNNINPAARKMSIPFEQQQQSSTSVRQETPPSAQGSATSTSTLSQPSQGESVTLRTPGSIRSLGSLIQSNKVPINRSQIEEFSMPDFSEESTSFKSHRKKTKRKTKGSSSGGSSSSSSRNKSTTKSSSSSGHHQTNNKFNINAALTAVSEDNSSRASSSKVNISQSPGSDLFAKGLHSGDFFQASTDDLFADFEDNPVFHTINTNSMPHQTLRVESAAASNRRSSLNTGKTSTELTLAQEAFENSLVFFEGVNEKEENVSPFASFSCSDSMKFMGSRDEWPAAAFGDENLNGSDGDELGTGVYPKSSWPAPPSVASSTMDSQKATWSTSASHDGSFLAPPSQASSSPRSRRQYATNREASEESISLQDAVRNMTLVQDNFSSFMSPSQLIQADEVLMSGISKTEFVTDFGAAAGIMAGSHTTPIDMPHADFEEIKTLLQDIAVGGNSGIMIDMLVGTIREHKRSTMVQELCLKHIWDHSKFNEAHKAHVMEAGLGKDVVTAMQTHRKSKKIQTYACGCIWSLSVSKVNRIALARAGAVKLLFRALEEFIDDEEVLETVFGALRTLSPENEVREAMVPILGARRVCRAMASHRSSTAIQRDGCAFLSNLAVDMEHQMVSVVTVGEISAVVRALGDHLRNESVVSSACFALKNYTYEEKNLRALRRFDEATSLLEDASKYSAKAEIRVEAEEIRERLRLQGEEDDMLEQIAYSSLLDAMDQPQITVDQAVENIREVLKQYEWSEKLICYGIGSVLSLSRQSEEYCTRIMQYDVLKTIVHTMYKQQDNANVQERGCETLKFLAQQGNRPRTMICDLDGSSILIAALRQHKDNARVRGPAVGALEELSKDPRCTQLIQMELVGGLDAGIAEHVNSLVSLGAERSN